MGNVESYTLKIIAGLTYLKEISEKYAGDVKMLKDALDRLRRVAATMQRRLFSGRLCKMLVLWLDVNEF